MIPPQHTVIPGCSDAGKSFQPVLICSSGNDVAVKLGRRVQVVVVRGESRLCQQVGLFLSQHAERAAGFHSQSANSSDHFQDLIESGIFGYVPPRGAHAESCRALRLCTCGGRKRFTNIQKALCFESGVVVSRLRAIGAVFGATSRLHAEQNATLNLIALVILAMCKLGVEDQFRKRKAVDAFDLGDTPVIAEF